MSEVAERIKRSSRESTSRHKAKKRAEDRTTSYYGEYVPTLRVPKNQKPARNHPDGTLVHAGVQQHSGTLNGFLEDESKDLTEDEVLTVVGPGPDSYFCNWDLIKPWLESQHAFVMGFWIGPDWQGAINQLPGAREALFDNYSSQPNEMSAK